MHARDIVGGEKKTFFLASPHLTFYNDDFSTTARGRSRRRHIATKGLILYLVFCHCHSHSHNAYQQCLPSSSVHTYKINIAKHYDYDYDYDGKNKIHAPSVSLRCVL